VNARWLGGGALDLTVAVGLAMRSLARRNNEMAAKAAHDGVGAAAAAPEPTTASLTAAAAGACVCGASGSSPRWRRRCCSGR